MDSFNQIWDMINARLVTMISKPVYDLWLSTLTFETYNLETNTFYLRLRESFKKDLIESKFMDKIKLCAKEVMGFDTNFVILLAGQEAQISYEEPEDEKKKAAPGIEDDYTFDKFIIGPSNEFAYNAAFAAAEFPGMKYNPLFIYGKSGVGKTHLLNAIKNKIQKDDPTAKIVSITAEKFVSEFLEYIGVKGKLKGRDSEFREKYRECDVLLIDDFQVISGKTETQNEFFHTFNDLKTAHKQIVMTCDLPPRDLKGLPDRLVSRFEEGMLADIGTPELETRIAIVKQKCAEWNLSVSNSTALYIAENVKRNIRQIEGIISSLHAHVELTGKEITPQVAATFIAQISTDHMPTETKVETIMNEVSKRYHVSIEDIKSEKRNSNIVLARQVAMYVITQITTLTQSEIGDYFSGKDHSTVIYAIRTLQKKMDGNGQLRSVVEEIINDLNS